MKKIIILSVLFSCFAPLSKAATIEEILSNIPLKSNEINGSISAEERWRNIENVIKYVANNAVNIALPTLIETAVSLNLSKECMRNSMHLINGIKNIKPWAMRFLDSSAKVIDGIVDGSLSNLGMYDECIDTEVRSTKLQDKGNILYRGQYCTIEFIPPLPPKRNLYKLQEVLPELKNFSERDTVIAKASKFAHFFYFLKFRMGVCVPSGCTVEDINRIAVTIGDYLQVKGSAPRCELKEENQFTPIMIFVLFAFSFAGFLMIIGSLIDIYALHQRIIFKSNLIRTFIAFSFFTNFLKFVNTETSSHTLSCLNGIRFLSMSWVILGHTYLFTNLQMMLGLINVPKFSEDFAFVAVSNSSVVVDTFLCIGGLLVGYLIVKLVLIQGQKFRLGIYVLHRLWRILPLYIYVILFVFLLNLIGSGPLWHETFDEYIKNCYKNWWTNLIFINNFYDAEHMCMIHSWYISADFQLYIYILIVILPMIKWPRAGIFLSVLTIIVSIIYSGIATYINNYPPAMLMAHPDLEQIKIYWAYFYHRPFIHAGPYCIGFLAGYILATKPKLKIPRSIQAIGWCLAFICNFSVLYGVFEWSKGRDPTFVESILYSSLNRSAWTMGVAWLIVCCATGHGGVINYILSWKAFVPLGRLTFAAYLAHPLVQLSVVGSIRTNIQSQHFIAVWGYFGHLVATYSIAFAGSMLIESPFMALEKIIFSFQDNKSEINHTNVKQTSLKNDSLRKDKNDDIAGIVPKTDEETGGTNNLCVVYKL